MSTGIHNKVISNMCKSLIKHATATRCRNLKSFIHLPCIKIKLTKIINMKHCSVYTFISLCLNFNALDNGACRQSHAFHVWVSLSSNKLSTWVGLVLSPVDQPIIFALNFGILGTIGKRSTSGNIRTVP